MPCAVVFFTFLVGLIGVYFPSGSALVGDRSGNWMDDFANTGDVELRMDGQDSGSTELYAGEIINMQRRVQRRGAKSLTWNDAQLGDKFVTDDAVQTFARSTALMEISDDNLLSIGENSLIVFDRDEGDPFGENADALIAVEEANDTRSGFLGEVMWNGLNHVGLGVGFNFTEFSSDLRFDSDYSEYGWFLRIQGTY